MKILFAIFQPGFTMNLVVILAAFLTIQIIDGAPVLSNDDQLVESSNRTNFELNSGKRSF